MAIRGNAAATFTGSIHGKPADLFLIPGRDRGEARVAMVLGHDSDEVQGAAADGGLKARPAR
jgi:hypothetical protein